MEAQVTTAQATSKSGFIGHLHELLTCQAAFNFDADFITDVPRNALVIASQNLDLDSEGAEGSYGIGGIAFWWIDEEGKAGKCQLGLVADHGFAVSSPNQYRNTPN